MTNSSQKPAPLQKTRHGELCTSKTSFRRFPAPPPPTQLIAPLRLHSLCSCVRDPSEFQFISAPAGRNDTIKFLQDFSGRSYNDAPYAQPKRRVERAIAI